MKSIKEELVSLLQSDEEFKEELLSILGINNYEFTQILRKIDDLRNDFQSEMKNQREEQDSKFTSLLLDFREEMKNQREEQDSKFTSLLLDFREEMKNQREEFQSEMKNQREEFQSEMKNQREEFRKEMRNLEKRLDLKFMALGSRWGYSSEIATRKAFKELFTKKFKNIEVSNWDHYDVEGIVFGHPSIVEIDIVIKDDEHWLIEYKSSANSSDVAEIYRIGQLYESVVGVKPKLFLITAFLRRADKTAKKLDVTIYTDSDLQRD